MKTGICFRFIVLCTMLCMVLLSYGQTLQNSDIQKLMKIRSERELVLKDTIPLLFQTHHTQGLTRIGDYFYLTAVDVHRWPSKYKQNVGRYDRDIGDGRGYIMKFNQRGELLAKVSLGRDSIYHPGGIDFDGQYIWIPVCEYRPNGQSLIYKLHPETMELHEEIKVDDAIGAVVYSRDEQALIGFNWDAADIFKWKGNPMDQEKWNLLSITKNNQYFIHYQDAQYIGEGLMLCSGLNNIAAGPTSKQKITIGGLQLLDSKTYQSLYSLPLSIWTRSGRIITGNPFHIQASFGKILLYFAPDDDQTTLYIYEVQSF